ncbi:mitotic spindle checkpoint protein MAD1-like [Papaver somniferum]|uniref:mitotic spindle checkpoint protein MAD1-like n=1 Tax=Papaver somniferum TaxID=3469 RepID=UPI000E7013DC|nr:mitotic spindle checkpoint protein MAD1-like [Papaver somniferum]
MITRTPAARKRRAKDLSNSPLVMYEDPPELPLSSYEPSSSSPSEQMLCTYQCRQMVKSEFLDNLGSAEKQVRDYKTKLESMNEVLSKTEAERKKFKDQFFYAEQELAAAKGREKALQEQLMKEVTDSQERIKKQIQSFSELEVKHQKEVSLRKNAESSAASAKDQASTLEQKLSLVSESMEREKTRLQRDLTELKKESKLSISRISADLDHMACKANNAEKESELLKTQLEDLHEQLNECMHQKGDLEKKLVDFSFQSQVGSPRQSDILVKHLQEELRNYQTEVQEARKLKSSHENSELLKEKLLEEKGRKDRAEAELLKLQEVLLDSKKLEDELMSWKSIDNDIPGISCAQDVLTKFAALQKEVIMNMAKVGEVSASLKQMEVALEVAELGKQQTESEAALAKEKAGQAISEVKRLESMLHSVGEERDRLRSDALASKKQKHVEAETEPANGSLIQELEASLAIKELSIRELEKKLSEQKEVITRHSDEIVVLNERLHNEARRIKSLEREGDRLRSEISLLESKLGHGDYSASSTKVLRMVNTLGVDNEAKHTIEALRTELEKAKEKLQAVEELKGKSDTGTYIDSNISEKLAQLKAQIATLEKREERYKTVFAEKISVFRRACCSLFGYKILMDDHQRPNGIPVTRFTLQSIFAQGEDEKLDFEYESGNTNLLDNEYTSQHEVAQQVGIFIKKYNSIPAFTANLTIESFNKRTIC